MVVDRKAAWILSIADMYKKQQLQERKSGEVLAGVHAEDESVRIKERER